MKRRPSGMRRNVFGRVVVVGTEQRVNERVATGEPERGSTLHLYFSPLHD
jgi:hypothetical protein